MHTCVRQMLLPLRLTLPVDSTCNRCGLAAIDCCATGFKGVLIYIQQVKVRPLLLGGHLSGFLKRDHHLLSHRIYVLAEN